MTATEQIMALLERWDRQRGLHPPARGALRGDVPVARTSSAATGASPPSTPPAPGPRPAPARTLPGGAGGGAGRRRHAAGDRAYGAGRFRRAGPRGGRPHRSRLDRTGRRSARVPRRRTARGAALFHRVALAVARRTRRVLRPGRRAARPRRRAAERRPHALRPTLAGTRGIVPAPRAGPPGVRGQRRGQLGRLVATRRADPPAGPAEGAARRPFRAAPAQARQRRRTARSISISPPCARRASPRPPRSGSSWTTTSSSPASPRPDTPSPGHGEYLQWNPGNPPDVDADQRRLGVTSPESTTSCCFAKSKHIMLWKLK